MRRPRQISLSVSTVGVVVVLLCACACGGSAPSTKASNSVRPTASGGSVSGSASPSSGSTALVQNPLPPASDIVNDVDKRKSVTITKCAAIVGGWAASGTASNPGSTTVDYTITVFFTNAVATVQDFATASVTVAPGQSSSWTASKLFAAADPTSCVLRGVG